MVRCYLVDFRGFVIISLKSKVSDMRRTPKTAESGRDCMKNNDEYVSKYDETMNFSKMIMLKGQERSDSSTPRLVLLTTNL